MVGLVVTLLALGAFCLWLLTLQSRGRGGSDSLRNENFVEVAYWKGLAGKLLGPRFRGSKLLSRLDKLRDD